MAMISQATYLIFVSLAMMARCEPPSAQYGAPISNYGAPNLNGHNQDNNAPKSYEFGYQVKDDYSGNNYKRQEASDGNQVQGEYRVQLPDGRTQIVTYYADWQTGFHADVRYEGEASYPDNYNSGFGAAFGGFGGPHGGFGGPHGGQQYGAPGAGFNFNGFNAPATSSVSIKDYSGPGTPYNVGGYGGGHGNGLHHSGGLDSYANAGSNFGGKVRPSATYGAP